MPRLAVLISGGGGLMARAIDGCEDVQPLAIIALVIASRGSAGGLAVASARGVKTAVVERGSFSSSLAFGSAVWGEIAAAAPIDGILLLGWMPFLVIPPEWQGRVVNAHPSLLPNFGGKGMYGRRVHEAVLAAGVSETGFTFHLASNEYDAGKVLYQEKVDVLPGDTPSLLESRVIAAQHAALPKFLHWWVEDGLRPLQDGM